MAELSDSEQKQAEMSWQTNKNFYCGVSKIVIYCGKLCSLIIISD
jgi:hypothetical protein